MKLMSRILLLLSITSFIAGCKLAVIVVEGGEVQSIGSGICVAGNICIVDVTDSNFYEHFEAVPDEGWYFHKWNSGDGFLCGGSINAECTLSFQGYEESKAVQDMLESSALFYLMPVFKDYPSAVEVDGKAWLQPRDFANYSYNEISAVCPGSVCSGNLPRSTFDLTGYTWASSSDVNALFDAYRKAGRRPIEDFAYTASEQAWWIVYVILSDPPYKGPEMDEIYLAAFSSSLNDPGSAGTVHIPYDPSFKSGLFGAWFWRPVTNDF